MSGLKTFEAKKRMPNGFGYLRLSGPGQKKVLEHIIIVERVLGRPLPDGAEVHHVNENRADNRGCNLVICESRAYHRELHRRARAVRSGFPAHWRKCNYCGLFDDPSNLYVKGNCTRHHLCNSTTKEKLCRMK